jgi:ubiquinone/menaquinone biosynthesis C-methylase UbiE/DNA-binding MarR family transcriptional regulator
MRGNVPSSVLVEILRSAGEPTRLRLLLLLIGQGEFNVKDLTQILGQSQPRLSRHLKLLTDAGLIERFQEGSSVFYRFAEARPNGRLLAGLLQAVDPDDANLARDLARADALRQDKNMAAQAYFKAHAAAWDEIRAHHAPEAAVEAAMLQALGAGPFELLVDLGTGTGRILELFAPLAHRAIGFDVNREMLAHARARLAGGGIHNAQLRLGDILDLPVEDGIADAVVIHQVLHFLDEPARAIAEAARLLKPAGRLLIVDFAPHSMEAMRDDYAHRRLGFERASVDDWMRKAGLGAGDYHTVSAPSGNAGKLTVSLWLAEKPKEKRREAARKDVLRIDGS